MKRIVIIPLLLSCALVASAQLDREAMERARMQANRIKECVQYTHKYTKDKPDSKGYKTAATTYDRNGNPTLIINYRANGQESSRLHYTYDAEGRRTEYRKEETLGEKQMKLSFKQTFTYDSRGNKKTETGFDGSSNYRIIYNYLLNGKLSDVTRYKADNSVSERWIYSYEGNKQIIRVTPTGAKPYTIERVYDPSERLLSDVQFDADNNPQRKMTYTYDSNGRIRTETESFAGQERYTLQYEFDSKGQLLKVVQLRPDGVEFVNNDYSYDREGNLVAEQWVDGDPSLVSKKESEFDNTGNMVKVDSYYAPYRYRVMYSYKYKKF